MSNLNVERQSSNTSNDKSAKYDRQLRLWGNHGQDNLENSRICLINASAAGTETLKNMVLPGVGYFTILDENSITEEDLANNFFVTPDKLGQSRAKVCCENLCELNPDIVGDYLEENIDRILANRSEYLKSFHVVIGTNLKESTTKILANYLWNENIPLILIRSYGLVGYVRIVVKEHFVVEAHPDNELPDLRLDQPFDELRNFCKSIDLENLVGPEHSHIPYLVILFKYLEVWKSHHNGEIPKTYKQKEEFKSMIKTGVLKNEESIPKFEENFEEALRNVNNSILKTQIPGEIKSLFDNEKCLNLNSNSKEFWIILRAIKEFTENEGLGHLPLRGSLPDMVSDSNKFVSLQNVYRAKAQSDAEAVMTRVERLLLNINKPFDYINEQTIRLYCKNAYFLKLINYRSLAMEYDPQTSILASFLNFLLNDLFTKEQNPDGDLIYYILMQAAEKFFNEYNRYPGANGDLVDSDVNLLKRVLNKLLSDHRVFVEIKEEYIHEICRYGNCEIHTVSAFLGGCAAHEAIKLLTNQFIPFNNTLVYNGINQITSVYEL